MDESFAKYPLKEIDGLKFEVITLEQIRRKSTVQVEDPRTYDAGLLDEPQLGG